jgi:hypothetical protein
MFEQAEEEKKHQREIGMLRYAMVKNIALEEDPHKMALTIARCANAIAKTTLTRHLTRPPDPEPDRPEWTFVGPWAKPSDRESFVQYIWRHRPKDFEERYMTSIETKDTTESATLDTRLIAEFEAARDLDAQFAADEKFLPPAATPELREEVLERTGTVILDHEPVFQAIEESDDLTFGRTHTSRRRKSAAWWANPDAEPSYPQPDPEPEPAWDDDAEYRHFLSRYQNPIHTLVLEPDEDEDHHHQPDT